jgi:hypothetical protein
MSESEGTGVQCMHEMREKAGRSAEEIERGRGATTNNL